MLALTFVYALLRKHTDVPFPARLLRLEARGLENLEGNFESEIFNLP